ncbi:hypothetical protein cypCar_00034571 [Cyprinus carpio]|nr:hypothetical protein cypCar_00034571 [Cyprinus carpio]
MLVLFYCLLSLTPAATEVGLGGKVLLFPTKTNTSFVKLTPEKPLSLSAFTLCMHGGKLEGNCSVRLPHARGSQIKVVYSNQELKGNVFDWNTIRYDIRVGLGGKVLLFPTETDTSFAELTPEKPLSLSAFTLCMRVATELQGERDIILFAYRTPETCSMMLVPVVLLLSLTPAATEVGLGGKVLLFPYETDFSYVKLTPKKPLGLTAFTLCMRVATELQGERQIILFAYRTPDFDELNVWREKDGRVSFYLSGDGAFFHLPPLSTFRTHLCLTWASRTGLTAFWVDGRRSAFQLYNPGHSIQPQGTALLGQDPDKYLGDFETVQSFAGELTDLNMWDYALTGNQIKALYLNHAQRVPRGNVFDWSTIEYEIKGNVLVVQDD